VVLAALRARRHNLCGAARVKQQATLRPALAARVNGWVLGAIVIGVGIVLWSTPLWWIGWLLAPGGVVVLWRGNRRRIVLTPTYLRAHGYFRNRTIPARSIIDVDDDIIDWTDRGRVRVTMIWLFSDDDPKLGGKALAVRREALAAIKTWGQHALKERRKHIAPPLPRTAEGLALDAQWEKAWPGVEPFSNYRSPETRHVGFRIPSHAPRWRKRAKVAAALRQHLALIERIRSSAPDTSLVVLFEQFGVGDTGHDSHVTVAPHARVWRGGMRPDKDYPEYSVSWWCDRSFTTPTELGQLVLLNLRERVGAMIVTNSSFTWRYQLTATGSEVIATNTAERDALRTEFAELLPRPGESL
jgi:hypothetical protein